MGSEHRPQNRNRAEAPQGFRLPTPWNSETTDHSPDMEKLYGILELAFTPSFVPLGAEELVVYNKGKWEGSREAVLGSSRRLKGGGPLVRENSLQTHPWGGFRLCSQEEISPLFRFKINTEGLSQRTQRKVVYSGWHLGQLTEEGHGARCASWYGLYQGLSAWYIILLTTQPLGLLT